MRMITVDKRFAAPAKGGECKARPERRQPAHPASRLPARPYPPLQPRYPAPGRSRGPRIDESEVAHLGNIVGARGKPTHRKLSSVPAIKPGRARPAKEKWRNQGQRQRTARATTSALGKHRGRSWIL